MGSACFGGGMDLAAQRSCNGPPPTWFAIPQVTVPPGADHRRAFDSRPLPDACPTGELVTRSATAKMPALARELTNCREVNWRLGDFLLSSLIPVSSGTWREQQFQHQRLVNLHRCLMLRPPLLPPC